MNPQVALAMIIEEQKKNLMLCPFCGEPGKLSECTQAEYASQPVFTAFVSCTGCNGHGPSFNDIKLTINQCKLNAISAWNMRNPGGQ